MEQLNVVVIGSVSDEALATIAAVDSRLDVADARGWFDVEIRETWPAWTVQRYLAQRDAPPTSRGQRDEVLATAEVILAGFPFPLDLRSRSPRLRWFHQMPAGASNLLTGDLWGSDVLVTTSRGQNDTRRPYAEYALAGLLSFARGFPHATRDQQRHEFDHRDYRPIFPPGQDALHHRRRRHRPGRGPTLRGGGHAGRRHPTLGFIRR
jgi:hypothetical protein